jgi:teichuronic acid exporter
MTDNLKQKTISAISWSFLEAAAVQGVRFIIGIILARLLFPEQFGLIGMLMVFFAVTQTFLDSGFGDALIQKREVTQNDLCSIFYFNIVVGMLAAGLLCMVAPFIAAFYKQPILTLLTRALSLTIVINSFGMIQGTILNKQINFKTQTKVSLIAGLPSGIIGIILAATGFGVWSLVVQQISSALFRTVSLWIFNPWRPVLVFSFRALREMFGFGSRMLFSSLLNQIFDNIYLVVIGKLFSAMDLGFFTRAKTLQSLPTQMLPEVVSRVTFPVFSSIQDDQDRLKRGCKRILATLALVNFPIMIGLLVTAHPLVTVLLTEKWAPSIPYLRLLCIVGLLYPLTSINLNVLQALGRSDLFLRLAIIKKLLIVINIVITWHWGITAMIYGMIVLSIIGYYLNTYYSGILIGYPILEQLRDLFPYLVTAIFMGFSVSAIGLIPFSSNWLILLVQITGGIVIYVSLCRVFRLADFMKIWQAFWNRTPFLGTGAPG